MKKFEINENDQGQRLDKFISKAMPELPKSMMYRLIRKKDIKLNGKRCEISVRLEVGDIVTVYVKDEVAAEKKHDMSFLSAGEDLDIVFENEDIIVVNKPVALDSHSNGETSADTLINRIKLYLYTKHEYVPDEESSFAPALCSRLDRNTCGLVTAAKNAASLRELNSAIRNGNVHKIYHCIAVGVPQQSSAVLNAYHKKDESRNTVRILDEPADGFKPIKTGYRFLESNGGLSLLEVRLYTGRTHQIRAHLAHVGLPVLGDGKYGDVAANKRYGMFRQALCAYSLSFELPEDSPLHYLNELRIDAPKPDFEKKYQFG
ncbi:MAG: RluA family pseudouridine synthase [Ruminococcus sp.]|nr:RluA family pseudouridine synthase [Ruminococcus sp.]